MENLTENTIESVTELVPSLDDDFIEKYNKLSKFAFESIIVQIAMNKVDKGDKAYMALHKVSANISAELDKLIGDLAEMVKDNQLFLEQANLLIKEAKHLTKTSSEA